MRYFILLSVMFLFSVGSQAQVKKRLFSHVTPEGSMYFVGKKKLTKHSPEVKYFEYDVTYVTNKDSVTINFSLVSDNSTNVSSMTLSNDEISVPASSVELLFHEMKGKKYIVRTTSKISYNDLKKLYSGNTPVNFGFVRADGRKNSVTFTDSQWKKEKDFFERVFYLINN